MYTADNKAASALSFLTSALTYVQPEVLRQPYPEIKYPRILPVDTSAPEYTNAIEFRTVDWRGEPALLSQRSEDIPTTDIGSSAGSVTVHEFALGYEYSMTEIRQAQELASNSRTNAINYLAEKAQATRASTEHFLDKAFIQGDDRTADMKTGLINDPNVPIGATGDFLPGSSDKTIDTILGGSDPDVVANELLQLFNQAVEKVRVEQTNTIYRPTHILLPPEQLGKMRTYRIPNTAETLISYLERVINVTFEELINLKGAGESAGDRMMVYTRDENFVKAHMPMSFQLQAPATRDNIRFFTGGVIRIAGTELRVPDAHLYVDDV